MNSIPALRLSEAINIALRQKNKALKEEVENPNSRWSPQPRPNSKVKSLRLLTIEILSQNENLYSEKDLESKISDLEAKNRRLKEENAALNSTINEKFAAIRDEPDPLK